VAIATVTVASIFISQCKAPIKTALVPSADDDDNDDDDDDDANSNPPASERVTGGVEFSIYFTSSVKAGNRQSRSFLCHPHDDKLSLEGLYICLVLLVTLFCMLVEKQGHHLVICNLPFPVGDLLL